MLYVELEWTYGAWDLKSVFRVRKLTYPVQKKYWRLVTKSSMILLRKFVNICNDQIIDDCSTINECTRGIL